MSLFFTTWRYRHRTTFILLSVRLITCCVFLFLFSHQVYAQRPQSTGRPISGTEREQILLRFFHPMEILGRARTDIQDRAQETLRVALQEGIEEGQFIIQVIITDKNTGEQTEQSALLRIQK